MVLLYFSIPKLAVGASLIKLGTAAVSMLISSPIGISDVAAQGVDFSQQRLELDRTVWSQEREAQQYGATFVALWDSLNAHTVARPVLEQLTFEKLVLGSAQSATMHDWDVVETRYGSPTQTLDPSQWSSLLARWEREGLELAQSEWHHEKFTPATGSRPARSLIDMSLHVQNRAGDWRLVVDGLLAVTWSDERNEIGHFIPAVIDASDLTMTERRGGPLFTLLQELDADASKLSPLIAADVDDDGFDDLLAAASNQLFHNRSGRFEPEPLLAYPPRGGHVELALLADFTGDGDPDLIVGGPEQFLGFYEGNSGFPSPGRALTTHMLRHPKVLSAGDIDADGDLDLWVGQYKIPYNQGQMPTPYYDANDGFIGYLLRNDGDGHFVDITERAGLGRKRQRRTYSGSLADLDGDDDLDLLVGSDFAGIDLYHNDGTGSFTDVTDRVDGETGSFGMSHAFSDYNADGRLDLYVVGMSSHAARRLEHLNLGRADFPDHNRERAAMSFGNRIYLADPAGGFSIAANTEQVARSGWSWGVASTDFDNDGDDDIYVANGHISGDSVRDYCTTFWTHDVYSGTSDPNPQLAAFFDSTIEAWYGAGNSWNGFEHNKMYLNDRGRSYLEIGHLMGVAFEFDARTVLNMDVDADGRVDLLVSEWSGTPRRERVHVVGNTWPRRHNWIGVRLRGSTGTSPVGARITLRSQRDATQWIYIGESFDAQRSSTRIFGLGQLDQVDGLEVRWPDGSTTMLTDPAINRYHRITPQ